MIFPEIRHIDDVLPFINNKKEFRINKKVFYTTIDYKVAHQDTFDSPESRECRGLVFYSNGQIMARRYPKFFNRGERVDLEDRYCTAPIQVFEKLDGTLISPILLGEEVRLATRQGLTKVSIHCEEDVNPSPPFLQACKELLLQGITPLFEYCSPNHRIILHYDRPSLTLTGARDNVSGEYLPLSEISNQLKIPHARELNKDFIKSVKALKEEEGVVIVYANGFRLKVKSDDYCSRSRLLDPLVEEKNVLYLVIEQKMDDLVGLLDESDYQTLLAYRDEVNSHISKYADEIKSLVDPLKELTSRKKQADRIKESSLNTSLCYQYLDGQDPIDCIHNMIRYHWHSQPRLDRIRYLIGSDWRNYKIRDNKL